MEIRNRITRLEQIAWRDIQPLQPEDLKHVVNFGDVEASIKKHGIANPFAVWQDADGTVYAVDGHIRKEVLHNMEGVPDLLPAFFVDAKNREEAITILLEVYNVNANPIDQEALVKWLEVERIEVERIAVKSLDVKRGGEMAEFEVSDVDLDSFFEESNTPAGGSKSKIVLEYIQEEYDAVIEAFKRHSGSKEAIVYKLLGL
jgi:hypothetical protein